MDWNSSWLEAGLVDNFLLFKRECKSKSGKNVFGWFVS